MLGKGEGGREGGEGDVVSSSRSAICGLLELRCSSLGRMKLRLTSAQT